MEIEYIIDENKRIIRSKYLIDREEYGFMLEVDDWIPSQIEFAKKILKEQAELTESKVMENAS